MSRRQNTMLSRRWAGGDDNTDYTLLPLTFKCLTGGVLSIKNENGSYDRNFEYSLNDGSWTAFSLPKSSGVLTIATLSPGDTISFRRDNENFYQAQFVSDSNLTFDIYGNLLSLQYGSAFNGQTNLRNTNKQAFGYTFKGTNVVDASKLMLTAPALSNGCYQQMFQDCVYLTSAPALPAMTATQNCYCAMFKHCTNLTSAPELPATTLNARSYYRMFSECYSLVSAPTVLPATVAKEDCYYEMFNDCRSLVNPPAIMATTLAKKCFKAMFRKSGIITAPSLPATTLVQECYYDLFNSCSKINYIKCLATDISASFCLSGWLANTSATGIFVKAPGVTWPTGNSGIPDGWTVIEATE